MLIRFSRKESPKCLERKPFARLLAYLAHQMVGKPVE